MDIKRIRQLLRSGSSVVLVEDGQPPLEIRELEEKSEPAQEVQISSRWPKSRPIFEERAAGAGDILSSIPQPPVRAEGDQILERLNREIMALKEQIAEEEQAARQE